MTSFYKVDFVNHIYFLNVSKEFITIDHIFWDLIVRRRLIFQCIKWILSMTAPSVSGELTITEPLS